jgi:hypothetical protein
MTLCDVSWGNRGIHSQVTETGFAGHAVRFHNFRASVELCSTKIPSSWGFAEM